MNITIYLFVELFILQFIRQAVFVTGKVKIRLQENGSKRPRKSSLMFNFNENM